MKAIEHYYHIVQFIMLYNLGFNAVNKTQTCDRSNESYLAVLSLLILHY